MKRLLILFICMSISGVMGSTPPYLYSCSLRYKGERFYGSCERALKNITTKEKNKSNGNIISLDMKKYKPENPDDLLAHAFHVGPMNYAQARKLIQQFCDKFKNVKAARKRR